MTSTSEEEEETQNNNKNEWQVIRRTKGRKYTEHNTTQNNTPEKKRKNNRYGLLTNETNEDSIDGNPSSTKIHKPPQIFVHGVTKCGDVIKRIRDIAEDEQYCTKCLANNVIEINCLTPETHGKLFKYFKENNTFYRTYRLKEERNFIKYLQHSTDTEDIRQEMFELGHNIRNLTNAHHRTTKEQLNLFFVDVEPAENNKKVYSIEALENKIIPIKPLRVNKNNIIQCMIYQQYGHTKSYCNKPFMCVKFGGAHNSTECKKVKKLQQDAHFAEAIILPSTDVAKIILT
jgi:hypothetical protein